MRQLPLVLLLLAPWSARPQEPVAAATLQRAQQLATVGAEHARLQRLVGAWDVALHTTARDATVRQQRGSVVARPILGGRYVVLNYVLDLDGERLEAVQLFGFDKLTELYSASWRDDHSTWAVDCCGPADADVPERLQLRGALRDAHDPLGRPFRLAFTLPPADGDRVAVALYDTQDGVERLLQTQEWRRR